MRTLIFIALLMASTQVQAAIIMASSPSYPDVSAAYNSAADGDTIVIPAGSATWTSTLFMNRPNVGVTLQGAGIGQTIITDNTPGTGTVPALVQIIAYTDHLYRLTGIEFHGIGASKDQGLLSFFGSSHATRIDHCKFFKPFNHAIKYGNSVCGVIDHCSFYIREATFSYHAFQTWHDQWEYPSQWGDGSWHLPMEWGTTNMVVCEDCDITKDTSGGVTRSVNDTFAGGRWCMRYCVITNGSLEVHGTETSDRYRGGRACEVYGVKIYDTNNWCCPLDLRSGTCVSFSNEFHGHQFAMTVENYRQAAYIGVFGAAQGTNVWDVNTNITVTGTHTGPWILTTLVDTNANWITNQFAGFSIQNATRIGADYWQSALVTGNDNHTLTYSTHGGFDQPNLAFTNGQVYEIRQVIRVLDGIGNGSGDLLNPGYQPTPVGWTHEAFEPIYAWSNTVFGGGQNIIASGGYGSIVSGRDYIYAPKPGYTPLVYPHPLVSGTPPPPIPPASVTLRIVSYQGRVLTSVGKQ